jgi:two-component system, LuxR family, response regulator FixJ
MQLPTAMDVWVIDDDDAILESLQGAFARKGWKVAAFSRVADFQRTLELSSPGCVVADFHLGVDSGIDLIRRVHEVAWPAPAILISGELTPTLTVKALREGAITVVEKPIRIEDLCYEVELALRRGVESLQALSHRQAAREALGALSEGHRAVLRELVECRPHKQIANRVDISLRTVEKRKKEIFERLNVDTFTELLGLLQLAEVSLFADELSLQRRA